MTELFTTNVLITAAFYNHNDLIFDTNTVHTTVMLLTSPHESKMLKKKSRQTQSQMRERLPAGIPLSEGAQHSLYSQIHAAILPGDHDKNFVF